jgi:rhamnulokinase
MGIELEAPVMTAESARLNFTNEGGIEGTTRFLKNITGMWLLEQCRAVWAREGREYTYPELTEMARAAAAFPSVVNPDDPRFANPADMAAEIRSALRESGQAEPATDGEMVACIYHSLTRRYREVLEMLRGFASFPVDKLHVIGGGSANDLMSQWTADALGIPVIAGPVEATAIGNLLVQAKAAGLAADRWEMRRIVAESFYVKTFHPSI